MTLKPSEARAFYDNFGKKQDSQEFYERPALDKLIAHAHLGEAQKIFEFGCGTGRLAARLLQGILPASATYIGCDLSATMVRLSRDRLEAFPERANVLQADGEVRFPIPDHSVDRVISTYALDLLSDTDTLEFLGEAHRVLMPEGRICLASLTIGEGLLSRAVSGLWSLVFRARPSWVGGCRPIRLEQYVQSDAWQIEYRTMVTSYGVPSEVLVARAK